MAPSSSASEPQVAGRLARDAEALAATPSDLIALTRVAAALDELGNRSLAARAFATLATAARDDGQLALAAYAAASLERLGDVKGGRAALAAIAKAYAKGSPRLEAKRRTRPPAPPRKDGADDGADAEPAAALKAASAALDAATTFADAQAQRAPALPQVPLVASLEAGPLAELLGVMQPVAKKPGEVVVEINEDARSLYLVARGTLAVEREGHELARLGAGAFFGEIALLSGARRTARVTAVEDVWLLEVPQAGLEAAAAKASGLADVLARHARARLLATTMRTSEIFSRLDADEREQLMPRFQPQVMAAGEKALGAGQEAERLHVIVSGDVDVRGADGMVLATLGAGDLFGEMSLLGRRPATADVVARTRTVTLSLDRAGFDDIAVKHPELLAEVYKLLVAREAENRQAATHHEVQPEDIVV